MNQGEMRRYRGCDGAIWGVHYTPFWQIVTIWTQRLYQWANDRASATATYTLIKDGIDDRP